MCRRAGRPGLRQRAPRHPAGSPSLMLRAGGRSSQSRSVHTLQVRVTQRGQWSIVRPHLPVALSVVWVTGPREKAEGSGPRPAVHQPPPGLRTTGVAPRPRPARPPYAPIPAPRRPRRRGLGPNARSAENRPSFAGRRHPPPPPPPSQQRASTGLRRGLTTRAPPAAGGLR